MFTGIVQAVGVVVSPARPGPFRIEVSLPPEDWEPWALGESVAVDGCCLTVIDGADGILSFDLSDETLARTTLGGHVSGGRVNVERAMRASDRFGGHFVQGHVDATGQLLAVDLTTGVFRFQVPEGCDRYLIDKGSICIDGVSLTVVRPEGREFEVALIPHTLSATNLASREPGSSVNLEFDVLAKHVERLLHFRS